MEHLGAPAQTLGEALCANGHDHEFLHVNGVCSVRAAVENIHHRNGKSVRIHAAQESVQRNIQGSCRSSRAGYGNSEYCVCAQLALVLCAVCVDHSLVDRVNIGSVHAHDSVTDNGIHIIDSLGHALAAETGLVAVAKLQSLEFAGGSAAGSRAPCDCSVCEIYLRLNGRIAAGVDYFAADDILNFKIVHVVHLSVVFLSALRTF